MSIRSKDEGQLIRLTESFYVALDEQWGEEEETNFIKYPIK
jgi:hypothetical protein